MDPKDSGRNHNSICILLLPVLFFHWNVLVVVYGSIFLLPLTEAGDTTRRELITGMLELELQALCDNGTKVDDEDGDDELVVDADDDNDEEAMIGHEVRLGDKSKVEEELEDTFVDNALEANEFDTVGIAVDDVTREEDESTELDDELHELVEPEANEIKEGESMEDVNVVEIVEHESRIEDVKCIGIGINVL